MSPVLLFMFLGYYTWFIYSPDIKYVGDEVAKLNKTIQEKDSVIYDLFDILLLGPVWTCLDGLICLITSKSFRSLDFS